MISERATLIEAAKKSAWLFMTVVIAMTLAMTLTLVASEDAIGQSERSRMIAGQVRQTARLITTAESGQRGYLYTGDEAFRPDLRELKMQVQTGLSAARDTTIRPELRARLEVLKDVATKKFDELEKTTQLYESGKKAEAFQLVLSKEGVQMMEQMRAEIDDILQQEDIMVAKAREKLFKMTSSLKILLFLGTTALGILSYLWVRSVTQRLAPLHLCVARAREIADNRFDAVELPVVAADDEVGSLTRSINEMTGSLRKGAYKVESARQRVQDTALSLSDRAIEQSAALTQLASGIQEISATVQELNLSASQMSEKVSALVEQAQSRERAGARGLQAVEESGNATAKVRDQVKSMADFTIALNEKAARVERIVFFVNELTERSNILSINAALLASTSGSGNEAFGVLAEEMQKLTSRSKDSTLEIHETLQSIRTEIQRVVLATEETTKQVEAGDQAASQASRSIQVLKEAVDEGNDTFLQIVAAVRQQNQALGQVEQALVAMRESAQLVEQGSLSLKEDAGVLAALNLELQNSDLLKAVRK